MRLQDVKLIVSTCKLVAGVVPRVLSVGLAGWSTISLQVLFQVPAFSFIKSVEEEGQLLDALLCVLRFLQSPGLTDHQRTYQT